MDNFYQLLLTALGDNTICDSYIAQTYADPWRKTWGLVRQYFMPTGNNATAIQAGKVCALRRSNGETFRNFIKRVDLEMAFLKSLDGDQPDYVLNGILRAGADPDMRTTVILGVAANQTYEFIRDQLLMVLPHPAQHMGGVQDNQFRVNNVSVNLSGNNGNKSGGKSKSKSKRNSNKSNNIQFQTGGYPDSRKKCEKCKNFGHTHKE